MRIQTRLRMRNSDPLPLLPHLVNRFHSFSMAMVEECGPQSGRGIACLQSFVLSSCQCIIPMSTMVVESRPPEWNPEALHKCLAHASSSTTCLITLFKAPYNVHHIKLHWPSRRGVIRAMVSLFNLIGR